MLQHVNPAQTPMLGATDGDTLLYAYLFLHLLHCKLCL